MKKKPTYKPRYFIEVPRVNKNIYKWTPAPAIRQHGWKVIMLKTNGDPSPLYVAMQQAEWLNTILDAWRDNDIKKCQLIMNQWQNGEVYENLQSAPVLNLTIPGLLIESNPNSHSVINLIAKYLKSPDYKRLKEKTQRDYKNILNRIIGDLGTHKGKEILLSQLERKVIKAYYEKLYNEVGEHTAAKRLTLLKLVLGYAIDIEWINTNVVKSIKIKTPARRTVIWNNDEITEFIKQADLMGLPSIADVTIIAVHTSQRQGDILKMTESQFNEHNVFLKQGKRGAISDVILTPLAKQRITAAIKRNHETRNKLNVINASKPMFVCERTLEKKAGPQTWQQKTFNTWFNKIRDAAAINQPSIKDKKFLDLRDTAITIMAKSGSSAIQIASVSGHSFDSVTTTLEHYVVRDKEMSDETMNKVIKHIGDKII